MSGAIASRLRAVSNSVSPFATLEPMAATLSESALNRFTQPQDVARAAIFLASDEAAGLTGVDLNVNSGAVMY